MSILAKHNHIKYKDSWEPICREKLDEEDLEIIDRIVVTQGDHGISAKIVYVSNEVDYYSISCAQQSKFSVGEVLDKNKCFIVTLRRGVSTCEKLEVED